MTGYHPQYIRNKRADLFVQDDIQLGRRFTLNAGLRYELEGPWLEKYQRWGYFDFGAGQVVYPRDAAMNFTTFPYPYRFDDISSVTRKHNMWAPRLGLAWRPFGDGSTVVRSAYGVFWAQSVLNPISNTTGTPPPYFLRQTVTSGTSSPEYTFGVFPNVNASTLLPTTPTFFTLDPNDFRSGYVQQWNFGIEHQILKDVVLKGSYVGSRGNHLEMRVEGNSAMPPAAGTIQARRRYSSFGSLTYSIPASFSTYNSMQLSAEKRFSKGLLFLAGYTWGKALDLASQWGGFGSESFLPQNPNDWSQDKGRSAHDVTQRFTLSFLYQLPFRFRNQVLGGVLGGWETSGIITLQSGFPFSVMSSGDIPNIGAGTSNERANVSGSAKLDSPSPAMWFNTSAFSKPAAYTFGNSGRNILDGPGTRNLDMTVMKRFRITERHSLQFRFEMFNAFNHPNYGFPNANVTSTTFGIISSASERNTQVGLKYIF
jgi:hypothetical protein